MSYFAFLSMKDDAEALQSVAAGYDEDVATVLEHLIQYTRRLAVAAAPDEKEKYQKMSRNGNALGLT